MSPHWSPRGWLDRAKPVRIAIAGIDGSTEEAYVRPAEI